MAQPLLVTAEEAGQKLLQFLARRFDEPQGVLHRWIRTGQVRINGGRAKPFDRVDFGDEVRVPPFAGGGAQAAAPVKEDRSLLPPIVAETDELIVFCKPAGLPVHPGTGHTDSLTARLEKSFAGAPFMPAPVHRLDRDTSGVLMFARDPETKELFQSHWNEMVTRRGYLAVVEGVPKPAQDTIRSFLVETDTHLSFSGAPGKGAKEAITSYQVVKTGGGYALLDINIETGRKNQIRVHMKELGHPVAGDKQYGARTNPIGRLCLHANELSFTHPATGEQITFKAKMPRDFNRVLR